jgi:hypothetical protein
MYIDCKTCGYESNYFLTLGPNPEERLIAAIENNGCSYSKTNGPIAIKCPQGHDADLLPTSTKFRKRYIPPS